MISGSTAAFCRIVVPRADTAAQDGIFSGSYGWIGKTNDRTSLGHGEHGQNRRFPVSSPCVNTRS